MEEGGKKMGGALECFRVSTGALKKWGGGVIFLGSARCLNYCCLPVAGITSKRLEYCQRSKKGRGITQLKKI